MDSGISNKMYPASRVSFDLPRKIGKRKEFSRKSARRVNKMWLSLLLWIHHGVNQAASYEAVLDHVYFVHPSTDISVDISVDISIDISTDISVECRPIYRPI